MQERRFDIVYNGRSSECGIDFHFCGEFDAKGEGCYGTNPLHGTTFESAKAEVIAYYKSRVEYWESLTEEAWCNSINPWYDSLNPPFPYTEAWYDSNPPFPYTED